MRHWIQRWSFLVRLMRRVRAGAVDHERPPRSRWRRFVSSPAPDPPWNAQKSEAGWVTAGRSVLRRQWGPAGVVAPTMSLKTVTPSQRMKHRQGDHGFPDRDACLTPRKLVDWVRLIGGQTSIQVQVTENPDITMAGIANKITPDPGSEEMAPSPLRRCVIRYDLGDGLRRERHPTSSIRLQTLNIVNRLRDPAD